MSSLDPVCAMRTPHALTCVSFASDAPVLVVGHAEGIVDVYRLEGTLAEPSALSAEAFALSTRDGRAYGREQEEALDKIIMG